MPMDLGQVSDSWRKIAITPTMLVFAIVGEIAWLQTGILVSDNLG
jgi:hypothetical protein